jgi:PqqD family protein of HPr-rel-A system
VRPVRQSGFPLNWCVVPGASLRWKIWDDHCVVFNGVSGQTHLLDPVGGLLLRSIEEGCSDSEELFRRLAELLDVELTAEVRSTLEQMLWQLDELGLIEPSSRETRAA